ncbi:uncharacterized protein LOC133931209 [Phragmites australis]|uniref:uncharacterized protein LOC133931209 n=1 Tax=Phragmites australis TaxID=29695 RepID=UPI002D7A2A4B|nr:uncharacterized protein LOC133931209 [Phragmites australis]
MPPRKRPAPSSPASAPPPDINPPEPSAPAPDSEMPTISASILAKLPPPEREVYSLIFAAGSKGMWLQDVRNATRLSPNVATKVARTLVARDLLKEVSDVRHRSKKVFMATDFQPSPEITGGTWYHDGRLDTDAVSAARRRCLAQVERLGTATAEMIHHGIERHEPRAGYAIDRIRDILRTMVLDKVLEEVKSTGEGEFAAVRSGRMCYRVAGAAQGGMMEGIPCGVCPRIDECSPEGAISPNTCVYYKKWLQMDF